MTKTIALVDDDQNILTSVSISLEAEGFKVLTFSDGVAALEGFKKHAIDLAVLDIKMPRMDGLETLRNLRKESMIPVIFLTSKDDEEDEMLGLKMGADDYITKPFSQKLLIARIRSLLRREEYRLEFENAGAKEKRTDEIITVGDLTIEEEKHLCKWKEQRLDLTVTEFLLLKSLAKRPGVVKSREDLITAAYDDAIHVDDRTVDTHIKRLRQKFKKLDDSFDQIETLYGVGYRYSQD